MTDPLTQAARDLADDARRAAAAFGRFADTVGGMRGQLDEDEPARNLVLATMRAHRVTEEFSMRRGTRWVCRCGSTSAGRPISGPEHQAQAVLDALRADGWPSGPDPEPGTIDGEVVPPAAIESSPFPHPPPSGVERG